MYFPHTSVFQNREYSSKTAVETELKKAKDTVKTLVKLVAFLVILNVLITGGLGTMVASMMTSQRNSDNKDDALSLENQNSHARVTSIVANNTVQFEQLQNQLNALSEKQTDVIQQLDLLNTTSTNHLNALATNLTHQLDSLNVSSMNQLDAHVNNLNNQLDKLNATSANQLDDLATNLNNQLDQLNATSASQLDALADTQTNLTNRLDALDKTLTETQLNTSQQMVILEQGQATLSKDLATTNHSLETLKESLTRPAQQVAFTVHTPTGLEVGGQPTFDEVVLNIGGAYNVATGIFSCPINGTYLFTLTIEAIHGRKNNNLGCKFYKNTEVQEVAQAYNHEGKLDSASITFFLHLSVEDVVKMGCSRWTYANKRSATLYAGALIKID